MGRCRFEVRPKGGGDAELTVLWPIVGIRAFVFENGATVSYEASEAVPLTRRSELILITIGPERFELVDAIVLGR